MNEQEIKTKFCKHCGAKFPRMQFYAHPAEDRLRKSSRMQLLSQILLLTTTI